PGWPATGAPSSTSEVTRAAGRPAGEGRRLRPAGHRRRHRRGQPAPRTSRRGPGVRCRGGDPAPPRHADRAAADQQPGEGRLDVTVVAAQWHPEIMDGLVCGARRALDRAGARTTLVRVPGSFELPVVAEAAARGGADAVVALGVVIRGETPHFDYV